MKNVMGHIEEKVEIILSPQVHTLYQVQ